MAAFASTLTLFSLVALDRALHLFATGDTSSFSEGACDEPDSFFNENCVAEFFQLPPVGARNRNRVSVSWAIMDLHKMDEAAGTISVQADIQMWWLDCRWPKMIEMTAPQWVESELRAMDGSARTWSEGASYVLGFWNQCGSVPDHFWTPVPKELFPNNADNTKSITESELYMKNLNYLRYGLSTALILDEDPLHFTYSFDYTKYPFDEQVMDLELKFDMFAAPELTTTILDDDGSPNGTLRDLSFISSRSEVPYEASAFSPHLSQTAAEALSKTGWRVLGAELTQVAIGNVWRLRFRFNIARKWYILIARFFVPLMSLLAVSCASFYLPLNQVMPRVAIGFVSFLSLAVFRSQAYGLLPNRPTWLVWVDTAMLAITEIMGIGVVMNIVALVVDGKCSHHGAQFVDKVVRAVFPLSSLVVVAALFVLGSAGWEPGAIMVYIQIALACQLVIMTIFIAWFLRRLPQILLRMLSKELVNQKNVWKDGLHLEPRELARIFRFLDKDGSGLITTQETVDGFERSGLKFKSDEERQIFRSHVGKHHESGEAVEPDRELGLDEFRDHWKGFLGGVLVRRLHLYSVAAAKDLPAARDEAPAAEPSPEVRGRALAHQAVGLDS